MTRKLFKIWSKVASSIKPNAVPYLINVPQRELQTANAISETILSQHHSALLKPPQPLLTKKAEGAKLLNTAAYTEDGMVVTMDISMFKPNEVKISVEGSWLVIEALQDTFSMEHNGLLHKHSLRRYALPENGDLKNIVVSGRDGILKIHVPQIVPEFKSKH